MRSLVAHRFDRNCVLAAVAGQILAALHLDCQIRAIVFGRSALDVGVVATAIELVNPESDGKTALIASAGVVAMRRAADLPLAELLDVKTPKLSASVVVASTLVDEWIVNGRLKALVTVLDVWTTPGEMTDLKWLNVLKDDKNGQGLEQADGRSEEPQG